ncbi:hypothetical protein GCM10027290_01410 [Micromonospora sonneratiae]|uniref:MaoC/PaaZ C-terminal domain-containing protein n=1 Tax=Micromonospora sonneratiae TaxID=1184706 RepID=A0ABW3Y7Z9_9ACTN
MTSTPDAVRLRAGGVAVPPLIRRIELPDMIAYAGATWDWHRLHYDLPFVRSAGFTAPVVDGQVLGALLAECLQDWLGPRAVLRRLAFRFTTPVLAGQTVRCEGATEPSEGPDITVKLRVVIVDTEGATVAVAATSDALVSLA